MKVMSLSVDSPWTRIRRAGRFPGSIYSEIKLKRIVGSRTAVANMHAIIIPELEQ